MSFDNTSSPLDINRNGQMFKRDLNINNNSGENYQQEHVQREPKLNVVQGNNVPDIGIDLLMNNKKHGHHNGHSHTKIIKEDSDIFSGSDQNSELFSDDDSASSVDRRPIKPDNKKKSYFVSEENDDDDDEEGEEDEEYTDEGSINSSTISVSKNRTYYKQPTEEDLLNEKKELLYQFDRLEKRGVKIPKRYTLNSDLEEMKMDFEKIKREKEIDASIGFQRKMLMAFVTGAEYLNTKFDPFDVKLEGWSESMHDDIQSYDDIFEELHQKYSGKSKMAPEVRLLFGVGGSAFMFHLTNSMFKTSLPGFGDVMKQNPDLMKQFASATMNTMASNGNSAAGHASSFMFPQQQQQQRPQQQPKKSTMRGPSNIDDILKDLEQDELDTKIEEMSMMSESENSIASSDASLSDLLSSKKQKKKKRTLNI